MMFIPAWWLPRPVQVIGLNLVGVTLAVSGGNKAIFGVLLLVADVVRCEKDAARGCGGPAHVPGNRARRAGECLETALERAKKLSTAQSQF